MQACGENVNEDVLTCYCTAESLSNMASCYDCAVALSSDPAFAPDAQAAIDGLSRILRHL